MTLCLKRIRLKYVCVKYLCGTAFPFYTASESATIRIYLSAASLNLIYMPYCNLYYRLEAPRRTWRYSKLAWSWRNETCMSVIKWSHGMIINWCKCTHINKCLNFIAYTYQSVPYYLHRTLSLNKIHSFTEKWILLAQPHYNWSTKYTWDSQIPVPLFIE